MNEINGKLLYAASKFTSCWEDRKDDFEKFCLGNWLKNNIANHMHDNYIDTSIPFTLRWYELDPDNQALLIAYLEKYY